MAEHPLRPATDRRLGGPLRHQLANPTSATPAARGPERSPAFLLRAYAVLIRLSPSYPPLQDMFRCITHPFATRRQGCPRVTVRLACVKHAASVQSEPGSNSSVQSYLSYHQSLQTGSATHSKQFPKKLLTREHFYSSKLLRETRRCTQPLSQDHMQPGDNPLPNPRLSASKNTKHPHASAVQFFKERRPLLRRPFPAKGALYGWTTVGQPFSGFLQVKQFLQTKWKPKFQASG